MICILGRQRKNKMGRGDRHKRGRSDSGKLRVFSLYTSVPKRANRETTPYITHKHHGSNRIYEKHSALEAELNFHFGGIKTLLAERPQVAR